MQFFLAVVVSILLYGCTTWTLTKHKEKKLDRDWIRMLRVILNKSWELYPTKQQLYGHLSPISKTIQIRRTRHAGHWGRSKDVLINDVLRWTLLQGRGNVGWLARSRLRLLCTDTGCSLEDLPGAMDGRDEWWERVRKIRVINTTRWRWSWWWWWSIYLSIYHKEFSLV